MSTAVENLRFMAVTLLTAGGPQNFLGAPHVPALLSGVPERHRRALALRMLALSPHYFYDSDLEAEHERNRRTRREIVERLVLPHVSPTDRVLDLGCGPGYLARAVSGSVSGVFAVDVSRGVLACARVLNPASNVEYVESSRFDRIPESSCDLAYSFAVAQHLRESTLRSSLDAMAGRLRSGGTLLMHFATPDVFLPEREWLADRSFRGRLKLRLGLNCFGRSGEEMAELATQAGFTDLRVVAVADLMDTSDEDVTQQHLLIGRRR